MPVINLYFTKLEANFEQPDKPPKAKGIKITNNVKLDDIKKKKIPGVGDSVLVDFTYLTTYNPKIGDIDIKGSLVFYEKKLKDFVKDEKGKIQLRADAFQEIHNTILGASTIQALMLAKELRLPPPIQLPALTTEGSKKGYA